MRRYLAPAGSTILGNVPVLGETCSYMLATRYNSASSKGRPMSWSPMGSPALLKPQGTLTLGWPVTLVMCVFRIPTLTPTADPPCSAPRIGKVCEPIRGALVGLVGVTRTSTS